LSRRLDFRPTSASRALRSRIVDKFGRRLTDANRLTRTGAPSPLAQKGHHRVSRQQWDSAFARYKAAAKQRSRLWDFSLTLAALAEHVRRGIADQVLYD